MVRLNYMYNFFEILTLIKARYLGHSLFTILGCPNRKIPSLIKGQKCSYSPKLIKILNHNKRKYFYDSPVKDLSPVCLQLSVNTNTQLLNSVPDALSKFW